MASSGRNVKLLIIVGIVVAGAGVAAYLFFGGEEAATVSEEKPTGKMIDVLEKTDPERADAFKKKADRLKKILENRQKEAERKREEKARDEADRNVEENGLTTREAEVVGKLVSRLYDPEEIAAVLASSDPDASAAFVRGLDEAYQDAMKSDYLEVDGDRVPITPPLRHALQRSNVLRSYSMNLMHAHAPGDLDRQREMVDRVNKSFSSRMQSLADMYPFMNVPLVESP